MQQMVAAPGLQLVHMGCAWLWMVGNANSCQDASDLLCCSVVTRVLLVKLAILC